MSNRRVNGQIQYIDKDGDNRHSDLMGSPTDPEYRKMLHDCLDEYLDNFEHQKELENDGNGYPTKKSFWGGAIFLLMKF